MICINCGHTKTSVVNSRPHKKQLSIWRRRSCDTCGTTFTTYEIIPLEELLSVSAGPELAPYRRGRLAASIITALTAAGITPDDSLWLLETIEQKAVRELAASPTPAVTQAVISRTGLARLTYETLRDFSGAAGLSYGLAHGIIKTASGGRKRRGRPIGS